MDKNKKNSRNKRNIKQGTRVTLPISDTIPGPGSYSVHVLNMNGGSEIPVVNATDLIDTTGAGTAFDQASALQAPEPGLVNPENMEKLND